MLIPDVPSLGLFQEEKEGPLKNREYLQSTFQGIFEQPSLDTELFWSKIRPV